MRDDTLNACNVVDYVEGKKVNKAKVLVLDIETAPMTAYVWALKDQFVGLNQLKGDWFILSWGAKWLGDNQSKFVYYDQSKAKDIENDKDSMLTLRVLLNDADFILTQNGKAFDWPKIKARFILNNIDPPSHFDHVDLYKELKGVGFTSHSLGYLTDKLCKTYKKLSHGNMPGLTLWAECLKGNKDAWEEMKTYNKHDVLSTEELYQVTSKWLPKVVYKLSNPPIACKKCGGKSFNSNGSRTGVKVPYMRKNCRNCGEMYKEAIR